MARLTKQDIINRGMRWVSMEDACDTITALESERNLIQQVTLRAAAELASSKKHIWDSSPQIASAILTLSSQDLVAAHDAQVAAKARLEEAEWWAYFWNTLSPCTYRDGRLASNRAAAESSAPKEMK
jgi:hypothetical protein